MSDELIFERLQKIFRKVLNNQELILKAEYSYDDVYGWDSLNNVTLISEIEKEFSIKFKITEIIRIKNVDDIFKKINEKL